MKRKDGFLILDEYAGSTFPSLGHSKVTCFKIDEEDWYFKEGDDLENCYLEVFTSILANYLHFPTALYDLACYHDSYGVISKSIFSKGKKIVYISELLRNIYGQDIAITSLEEIWMALEQYYGNRENKREIIQSLMREFVNAFLLQILIGNVDVNTGNLCIIDDEMPHLSPNFDYGLAFSLQDGFVKDELFGLCVSYGEWHDEVSFQSLFFSFFSFSDEAASQFAKVLQSLPEFDVLKSEMEQLLQVSLPQNVLLYLQGLYTSQMQYVRYYWDVYQHHGYASLDFFQKNDKGEYAFRGKTYSFKEMSLAEYYLKYFCSVVTDCFPFISTEQYILTRQEGKTGALMLTQEGNLTVKDLLKEYYEKEARFLVEYQDVHSLEDLFNLEDLKKAVYFHCSDTISRDYLCDSFESLFLIQVALGIRGLRMEEIKIRQYGPFLSLEPIDCYDHAFEVSSDISHSQYGLTQTRALKSLSYRDSIDLMSEEDIPALEDFQRQLFCIPEDIGRWLCARYKENYAFLMAMKNDKKLK